MNAIDSTLDGRPIVVRFGALGDTVMLLPIIDAIAKRWGRSVNVIASGAWSRDILTYSHALGELILLAGTRRRPLPLSRPKRALVRWLANRPSSPIFVFERARRFDDILKAAGTDKRQVADLANLTMRDGEHQIDYHARLACQAFAETIPTLDSDHVEHIPVIRHGPGQNPELMRWLQHKGYAGHSIILLQPGNKRTMRHGRIQRRSNHKYWPITHWVTVMQGLHALHPEALILICGAPKEQDLAQRIVRAAGIARAYAIADELPLNRLIALCHIADAMISVDTGPAHLAAAVGCPLVVLFGPTDPRVFMPRGRGPIEAVTPMRARANNTPLASMADISPHAVLAAWHRLRARTNPAQTRIKCVHDDQSTIGTLS